MPGTMGGKIIDTDLARLLCNEYAAAETAEDRIEFSESTGVPVNFFVDYLYYKKLFALVSQRESESEPLSLVILAGGYGSGKTTAVRALDLPIIEEASLIRDRSMDEDFKVPKAMITAALRHKITVTVIYVYRPVEQAFRGMVDRASSEGRVSPVIQTGTAHWQAQDNVLKLHQHFGHQISIIAIDNSDQPINPKTADDPIDFLSSESIRYKDEQDAIGRTLKEYKSINRTSIPAGILAVLEKDLVSGQQALKTSEPENQFWNKVLKYLIDSWFSRETS